VRALFGVEQGEREREREKDVVFAAQIENQSHM